MQPSATASPPTTCPYCSAILEPGSQVCPSCGRWIDPSASAVQTEAGQTVRGKGALSATSLHNRRTLPILLAVAGVLVILLCGLLLGVTWWLNQQKTLKSSGDATQASIALVRTATGQAVTTQAVAATQEAAATQEGFRTQFTDWNPVINETFDIATTLWYTGTSEDKWARGSWSVADGQYQIDLEALDGFSQWMWPDMPGEVNDFYLSTRINFIEGPDTMDSGLIFRLQNESQFYLFDLQANGSYAVYYSTGQGWETIIDSTLAEDFNRNEPNTLEVIGQGNEYTLFLNKAILTTFQDDRLHGGWVGIQVGLSAAGESGRWGFDDFVLKEP